MGLFPIIIALAQAVFDHTFIVCCGSACDPYREGGGALPEEMRDKISVLECHEVDARHAPTMHYILQGTERGRHKVATLLLHLSAMDYASQHGMSSVLVIEADAVRPRYA